MPQQLTLSVGETHQLLPPEGVEKWTTDSGATVLVSDENLLTGRHGGALTAVGPGRAIVRALGAGPEILLEIEVTVPAAETICIATGAVQALPAIGHGSAWQSSILAVAEVLPDGQVRGISAGIAILRGGGQEVQIRVSGVVDVGPEETVRFADRFAVPVRSWRAASTSASVDRDGVVRAGTSPRTVAIIATLQTGEEYSIDLRIRSAAQPNRQPAISPSAQVMPQRENVPSARQEPLGTAESVFRGSSQEDQSKDDPAQQVQTYLAQARAHSGAGRYEQAGTCLTAAAVAATASDELLAAVAQAQRELRAIVASASEKICSQVVLRIAERQYTDACQILSNAIVPRHLSGVLADMRDLAVILNDISAHGFGDQPLDATCHRVWEAAIKAPVWSVLPLLATIAVEYGLQELPQDIVAGIGNGGLPTSLTVELEELLRQMGEIARETVLDQLTRTAIGHTSVPYLQNLLLALTPGKAGATLKQWFRRQSPAQRDLCARHLAGLATSSPGDLLAILGGILATAPLDKGFPEAIIAHAGRERVKKDAMTWAVGGDKDAQRVLHVLFGYSKDAFSNQR